MSDTSLYSGIYAHLRDFAELLDDVLIELKSEQHPSQNDLRAKLGMILKEIGDNKNNNLSAQLLRVILEGKLNRGLKDWQRLGSDLLSSPPTSEMIDQLESIAKVLEHERAGAFAKMRGY